jgi:hypothetical protein
VSAREIRADQVARNIKQGTASSVRTALWTSAEIFPNPTSNALTLTSEQELALGQFSADQR